MKTWLAGGRWGEKLLHRSHRAVVEIRRSGPDAREVRGPVFLCAANRRACWRGVAIDLKRREKLIEAIDLLRREHRGANRIGSDFIRRVQSIVALRAVMT